MKASTSTNRDTFIFIVEKKIPKNMHVVSCIFDPSILVGCKTSSFPLQNYKTE